MKRLFLIFLLLIIAVPCLAGQPLKRHLEPETVNYFSLPSSSGDQFTLNEQIKLIKYNNGSVTLSGLTANFSNTTSYQFVTNPSSDLRKWIGYYITFTSSAGNTLKVKVSAAGTGETLGNELIDTWTNRVGFSYDIFTLSGSDIVRAQETSTDNTICYKATSDLPGALTKNVIGLFTLASGNAPVYHINHSGITLSSGNSDFSVTPTSGVGRTDYVTQSVAGRVYHGFRNSTGVTDWSATGFSSKQVLTPSALGVYFTDPVVTGTFDYNAASFTAVVTGQ